MREHGWALLALAALTVLGFFTVPGHTYLQSDTQIYLPLLERLIDPTLFEKDLIIQGQHVSFTIYDEVSVGLRKITGTGFEPVLQAQQLVFRFCALAGVYLLVLALQFGRLGAVFAAACFGLGAWITGPSILTFEYEPVPRGNAVGLTMLALGLTAHHHYFRAGAASALAFLYQVPAVYPFWGAYMALSALPGRRKMMRGVVAMMIGIVLMLALAKMQRGETERQAFFERIDAKQEQAMRQRASYNWVSMWAPGVHLHHLMMLAVAAGAMWRLRQRVAPDLRFLLTGLLAIGILSIPLSYLLLEGWKWNLIPQIQPARALLYVTALAGILSTCAGMAAAEKALWVESAAWFLLVFALPSRSGPITAIANVPLLVASALAVLAAFAWWQKQAVAILALAVVPYFAIPKLGGISNYPNLHTPALRELSAWARQSTPRDSVFFFSYAGRNLQPGIFRANSLRAVYVDWKGGGQINYLRRFLDLWLPRWNEVNAPGFVSRNPEIQYVVVPPERTADGLEVFHNAEYRVYQTPK